VQNLFTACRQNVDATVVIDSAGKRQKLRFIYRRAIDAGPTVNQRLLHAALLSLTPSRYSLYTRLSGSNRQFQPPYNYCCYM
jgi:hypothetical protein